MTRRFMAFDLGAESGRALVGELDAGVLAVRESRRFLNSPLRHNGALQWDVRALWQEICRALDTEDAAFDSVGLDAWGCDFALLDGRGELLDNPYHYRDRRTDGVMASVTSRVSRERIYAVTGVQFLPFNTLYQWRAACEQTPRLVDAASTLLTIPDLFNYWFTGTAGSELTVASTTQCVDARSREWARDLLGELALPVRLLPSIVEPGTILGRLGTDVSPAHAGTPIVAPACHDTGSAFASVAAGGDTAFLSSGTWSLLGTERPAPILTADACALNFTNEGGVCGTTRLLKNITGLWLLQACRRSWAAAGHDFAYDHLMSAAADPGYAFGALVDPDDADFLHPDDMVAALARYCEQTGQPVPASPPAWTRAILESLALKYRLVLDGLESLTHTRLEVVRVVGGGARSRLLNQLTADATGRIVIAGPVEATALGNVAMQMLATGAVTSLAEARAVIDRSFPVERFEPVDPERWTPHYTRFRQYLERTRD